MYFIKSLDFFNFHDEFKTNFKNENFYNDGHLILHKGHYLLNLFLQLSKLNESDRFAILLDKRIIFLQKLDIRKKYCIKVSIKIDILNENSTLSFFNNSDDLLIANTIEGGLYMSDSTTFSIISIDNANNKSFDLTLSEAFTNDFTAKIKSLATAKEYTCSLVSNSLFPDDPLKKTLVIGKVDYYSKTGHSTTEQALIDMVVPSHQTYEITVLKNDSLNTTASKTVILESFDAISDPSKDVNVNTIGDRILQVSFKYPLKNMFDVVGIDANGEITTTNPVGHVLTNFYALYYGRDNNGAVDPTKIKWNGAFNIDRTQFSATLSSDGKTMILQDNNIGMPLTDLLDPHKMALNKGKYHLDYENKTKVLTDYSEEKRIIPKIEVPFTTTVSSSPAIPINAVAPVRNKVTITFDKSVMKPLDSSVATAKILFKNDGTPGGTPLTLSKITRPDNDFKTLIFELDPSNPLPSGPITLGIGEISEGVGDLTDACGYLVPRTNLTFTVGSIPPVLLSAIQDKDIIYTDNTVINLTFSNSMNPSATGKGALNTLNYTLVDNSGNSEEIKSAEFVGTDNKVVKLTFKYLLGAGDYRLIISSGAITDTIGEPIGYTNVPVKIEDTTKPSIVEIIGLRRPTSETSTTLTDKDNALIIKYKTPMLVSSIGADNQHAADNYLNYKFVETIGNVVTPPTEGPLPDGTATLALKDDKWIRFVLPTNLTPNYPIFENKTTLNGNPNPDYSIYIGYTELDGIRNVRNTSGNIYPLCDLKKITATVPLIDLTRGIVEITSDSELKYTYTDKTTITGNDYHNEFYTLSPADFVIKVSNSIITDPSTLTPLNIKSLSLSADGTTITFKFANETFNSAHKYAYIDGNENVLDIFGKSLTPDVFNNVVINSVPSTLMGVSLTKISATPTKVLLNGTADFAIGYPIEIALKFSNIIKNTSTSDFLITFNNTINSPITDISILQVNGTDSDTILVKSYIPSVATDNLDNILLIRTVSDKTLISTKDINKNTISPFNYQSVINLSTSDADWTFTTANDLNGAALKSTFNKELDFKHLPLSAIVAAGPTGLNISNAHFVTTDATTNILTPYITLVDGNSNRLGRITLRKIDATKSIFVNSTETKVNEAFVLSTNGIESANTAKTNADLTPITNISTVTTAVVNAATATNTAADTARKATTAANVTALNTAANNYATAAATLATATNTYLTNINAALTAAQAAVTAAQAAKTTADITPYDKTTVVTLVTTAQTKAQDAVTAATTANDPDTLAKAQAAKAAADDALTAANAANITTPTQALIDAARAAINDLVTATEATVTSATTAIAIATTANTSAIAAKSDADNTKAAANAANATSSDSNINFNINIKKGTEDTLLSFTFSKVNQTDDLTLNSDNLAYVEYTGQEYQFMDAKQALYANTSLDYNANTTLK